MSLPAYMVTHDILVHGERVVYTVRVKMALQFILIKLELECQMLNYIIGALRGLVLATPMVRR